MNGLNDKSCNIENYTDISTQFPSRLSLVVNPGIVQYVDVIQGEKIQSIADVYLGFYEDFKPLKIYTF